MEEKSEDVIYLEPVIEEEELIDLDEDAALFEDRNTNCVNTC